MKPWSDYHTSVSKAVTIRGVTYSSRWQAAKALGVKPQNVYTAARDGWLDRVGTKSRTRKHEPFTDHSDRNDQPTGEETNADGVSPQQHSEGTKRGLAGPSRYQNTGEKE